MKRDDYVTNHPYDWADKVVMRACAVAAIFALCILIWGR